MAKKNKIKIDIISPQQVIYSGEEDRAVLPGRDGEFAVLPDHTRLVSLLRKGEIRLKTGGEEKRIPIEGGVAKITKENVEVLVK